MTLNTFCAKASCQLRGFAADETATTAIEYAMIAAGIATAIIAVVQGLGSNIRTNLYDKIGAVL